MATQTQKGKAFEYACLKAVSDNLSKDQPVLIDYNAAYETANNYFSGLDQKSALMMEKAALAAYRIISRLEPQLQNHDNNSPLCLSIQDDAKGIIGDVRDVLCKREHNGWEIGISCKHNHSAVKHSRLSQNIDFGFQWFGIHCSSNYFSEINPLFHELVKLRDENIKWSQIADKSDKFYIPLLNAFTTELLRLNKEHCEVIPALLLSYLLGKNDFYKVITKESKKITQIQAYNIFGTLNRQSAKVKPETKIEKLKLPTKFYDISYKTNSKNTIIVTCDNGWAISFRIHNASTYVEPSLKFDVQLVGVPQSLHTQVEPWS